jgi:NAD(P)-dependent dehydrogenase (short-subunit alcohol dehydrogenase family)
MKLSKNELESKVAIITGAGRGIGRELAHALAWLGANVVIAEISDDGKSVETEIRENGGKALYIKTDVSNLEEMENLKKRTYEKYGKVDILVNNATIIEYGSILDQSIKAWDNAFNVNVKAAIYGIKLFLPDMVKRREGTIITMSTDEGTPYLGPYSATKSALQSLTLGLIQLLRALYNH